MYLDLMNEDAQFLHKYLWKLKLPLKIKIFMWFLRGKVLLTKDNLIKRKWKGCSKYCFYDSVKTVQHLFISCPFARIIWRMIYFTYNIPPTSNITNMFGNWLNGVPKDVKARIRIRASALCWSTWTWRNNIIFNTKGYNFFAGTSAGGALDFLWSYLLPEDQREHMVIGCNRILTIAQDYFFRLLGGSILIESKMDSILLLCAFRWLIHVSTLADP
jgi:hypothetical protein